MSPVKKKKFWLEKKWLVAPQQYNNLIFELLIIIDDITICKTYVIIFVVILALINFWAFLKENAKGNTNFTT